MGMAHRKLGHAREAIDLFQRYRTARGAADRDVPVDRYIEEMQRELARGPGGDTPAKPALALGAPPPRAPDPQADVALMPVGETQETDERARPGLLHRWWFWAAAGAVPVAAAAAVLLVRAGGNDHCTSDVRDCEPFP